MIKASAFVWSAAALERYVADELKLVLSELTSVAAPTNEVRLSLLALLLTPEFDRLANTGGLRKWIARAELLEKAGDTAAAVFRAHVHPLDRRTIKADHFDSIWAVCRFTGDPLPSPRHRLALTELSRARNDLAHGRLDPIAFGRAKTTVDTIRAIDAVEDVAQHLHLAAESYITTRGYRR
jgi:hypothetical protein